MCFLRWAFTYDGSLDGVWDMVYYFPLEDG